MRTHTPDPSPRKSQKGPTASSTPTPKPAARAPKKREPRPRWYHLLTEPKPPEFALGPLVGTQLYLATIICPAFGYAVDRRALQGLALDGDLWIVKSPVRQRCRVYFRDQVIFAQANANHLSLKSKQKET